MGMDIDVIRESTDLERTRWSFYVDASISSRGVILRLRALYIDQRASKRHKWRETAKWPCSRTMVMLRALDKPEAIPSDVADEAIKRMVEAIRVEIGHR